MSAFDSVGQANALLATGNRSSAISIIEQAAAAGQSDALFTLAIWLLAGDPTPRDLPRARAVLKRCVATGHCNAAIIEIALTATGAGAPADWRKALALLAQSARTDPVAAQHEALVAAMSLSETGDPLSLPEAEPLGATIDVRRYPALLSPAECTHIIDWTEAQLQPAVVIDPRTGRTLQHPIRTSDGAVISPARESLAIHAITRRLAAASGTQTQQGEPLAVLRYAPGQQYRPHLDTITGTPNQRVLTVLVYLNEGFRGGETVFTATGLKIAPRLGDAIVFSNVLPDGRIDQRAIHAGLPVTQGVKRLATRWIRARPYDPWNPPRP
ncbi:2OG-Fe(II) oxygenase [Sphingomonas sp. UYP23]